MKAGKRILSAFLVAMMLVNIVPIAGTIKAKAENVTYQVGDVIEFGTYPQSLVTEAEKISQLDLIQKHWVSYEYSYGDGNIRHQAEKSDYMEYADIYCNESKYRAVRFSKYRPYSIVLTPTEENSRQDDNGFYVNTVYYFKYEPIQWRILDPSAGLVLSESAIDCQPFHDTLYYIGGSDPQYYQDQTKTYFCNDYAHSSVRYWLNHSFFETAFSGSQQGSILQTTIENGFNHNYDIENAYTNRYPTCDLVYLLSWNDVRNEGYGFVNTKAVYQGQFYDLEGDASRKAKETDYARCQGPNFYKDTWLLRTAGWEQMCEIKSGAKNICAVSGSGNVYGSYETYKTYGIRPAMCIDLNGYTQGVLSNQYILTHKLFAENTTMPESFGFYNRVWNEENGRRLGWAKAWEVVGDIGEIVTLKFDDLEIDADFYDLFLSDIILKLNQQKEASELKLDAIDLYGSYYGKLKNLFKSTDQWNSSVIDGSELDMEIEGFLTDPDFKMKDNTYKFLQSFFGDFFTNHADHFTDVFNGLNTAADICDHISTAGDVVNAFQNAYNAYIATKLFQKENEQFFTILYHAASRMENKTYANWFKENLDRYFSVALNGDAVFEAALSLFESMGEMTYDLLIRDVAKNLLYQVIAEFLGCAAGPIAAVMFAYTATYGILDKVTKLDKKTKAYEIMTYIAPIEQALCDLEDDYANVLIGSKTMNSAEEYDYFYQIYKAVNLYLYQSAYDFCAAAKLKKDKAVELEVLTRCTDQWKKSSCHRAGSGAARKYTSVQCPVDVYAYNAEGESILEIINDEIVTCDESITALTFDGKKSIVYPADQDYSIKIVARESGEMDYYISEIQDDESTRQIEFYDIPLSDSQVFTGEIPEVFDVSKTEYALSTNDTEIASNYDSKEATCAAEHTVSDWETLQTATCIEQGEKAGLCGVCGKEIVETIEISDQHQTQLQNSKEATCTAEGYTGDQVCTVCKQTITKGTVIGKKAHTLTTINQKSADCTTAGYTGDQYCTICNQTINQGKTINALGHTAPDSKGNCTRCGAHIKDVTPSQPQTNANACKWCGKVHNGNFFDKIVGFFHSILAIFKR